MVTKTLKKWLCLGISMIKLQQKSEGKLALLDTSVDTDNLGDFIIMRFCEIALEPLLMREEEVRIPTHSVPKPGTLEQLKKCDRKIVCGTNILYPEIEHASIWKLPSTLEAYKNCTLMGAGWGYYSDKISLYTKIFYHFAFDKKRLHAVRDQYTCDKLKKIGINNVIYTGCPTMWNLTPEFCKGIPEEKGKFVITTVTAYEQEREMDAYMIENLCDSYEKVYAWPQGKDDEAYIRCLVGEKKNLLILDRSLEAFEDVLKFSSIDYVGTRLHGGVMALNAGKRSLIIATDNRAEEIGRDTNLPVLNRKYLKENFKKRISKNYKTEISMPFENIEIWKRQFI